MVDLIGDPVAWAIVAAFATLVAVLAAAVAVLAIRWNRRERGLRHIEGEVAEQLDQPGLRFEELPAAIAKLNADVSVVLEQIRSLEAEQSRCSEADIALPEALFELILATVKSIDADIARHVDSPEVARLLDVLTPREHLQTVISRMSSEEDFPAPGDILFTWLSEGVLDDVLTTGSFLDCYFADRHELIGIRAGYALAAGAVRWLLADRGIQVVVIAPGSRVPVGTPDADSTDLRNVKQLAAVRDRARRMSRTLGERELLVVECRKPGWDSDRHGRRPPELNVYAPASWS